MTEPSYTELLDVDPCCDGGLDVHEASCPLYGEVDVDPETDGVSPGRLDEYLRDD